MATKKVKSKVTHTYTFNQVDTILGTIVSDGLKLQQKIHNLGVCIFKHWHDNPKDVAVVTEKVNALVEASGYHKSAVGAWVQLMSPFEYSEETKKFYVHKDAPFKGKAFMSLRDKPFWECKKPAEVKALNLLDTLVADIAKVQKRIASPKEGVEDDIDRQLLRDVIDAVNSAKARAEAATVVAH